MFDTPGEVRTSMAVVVLAALAACGGDDPAGPEADPCAAVVDLFPVPVNSVTSPFPDVDDSFLLVDFDPLFDFPFYGTEYGSVYVNSNGGMTFGAGDDRWDVDAAGVADPGIAIFWGDMAPASHGAETRASQMTYQVCSDAFILTFNSFQDHDEPSWSNTATVTLSADGRIVIDYGSVLSEDILVGVFDGTHANDRYVPVTTSYLGYSTSGSGTILFDAFRPGSRHNGELSNRRVTFIP
jgi:hypothetical protein